MKNGKIFIVALSICFAACVIYFSPLANYYSYSYWFEYTPEKYEALKEEIAGLRKKSTNPAADFEHLLVHRLFPFWMNTDWDFNGKTQTPRRGSIACGYFVTTCLRDMGLFINRDKLAQLPSEQMIKQLCATKNIRRYADFSLSQFLADIEKWGAGLYLIGLDKHTGFLLYEPNHLPQFSFIHSGGFFPARVVRQDVSDAKSLCESRYRVAGKLTADQALLKKWTDD